MASYLPDDVPLPAPPTEKLSKNAMKKQLKGNVSRVTLFGWLVFVRMASVLDVSVSFASCQITICV
jgi:hypothetical protein